MAVPPFRADVGTVVEGLKEGGEREGGLACAVFPDLNILLGFLVFLFRGGEGK